MHRLHRAILGTVIVPLALASCANATVATPGEGGTAGGGSDGSPGLSVPGSPGSGGAIDPENPVVVEPCGVEEIVGEGPDASVGYTPCPSDQLPVTPVASPVEPTPGMAGVRARGWDTADISVDGLHVTISFVSGIEPCAVLDHVDVAYGARAVTVTLFEGYDPDAGDVACIEIGVFKTVAVDLTEPVGDRTVRDGAA